MATPKVSGDDPAVTNGAVAPTPKVEATPNTTSPFPPPKTDKPRPHVCQTCGRSFARLEHLKRHERSHTKEKPFECPQCTRCFARRDLLLRHQQKLHQAGAASSRPRGGRRDSTSGVQPSASTRVRKNSIASSVASAPSSTMRPRANTISHIDGATLMLLNQHPGRSQVPQFGHNQSLSAMPGQGDFDMRAMTMFGQYNGLHPLPKIETNGLGLDLGGGLKTAPISMMGEGYDVDKMFGSASTVNPAQLHFGGAIGTPGSPFNQGFPCLTTGADDDESFDWTGGLGDTLMSGTGDVAVDGSSPSAISTGSQSGFSEVMVDGSNNMTTSSSGLWHNSIMVTSSQFSVDPVSAAVFPELVQQTHTVSPKDLHDHNSPENLLFSNTQQFSAMSPTSGPTLTNQFFQPALAFGSDTTSMSSTSAGGSGPQSSVTTMSTDSITDATRQALLFSLSKPTGFGHTGREYSQPSISSPLSPPYGSRQPANSISLPSTADLQRYVNAYIHYFHPHMPFLHIPTLSFDSPVFTANMRAHHSFREGIVGGGGCLILAMAAIGASYEFEHKVAKDLFEYAKRIISIYLEERRKASTNTPSNVSGNHAAAPAQKTPLWLVQAMLLNLIYGHQCGDRIAAEIATTHCAALVSLAKAADLENADPDIAAEESRSYTLRNGPGDADVEMGDESRTRSWRKSTPHDSKDEHSEWFRWKSREERKRTLLSVFVLSSLLVTAYNHQPRILNSELHVDLPCEENLWGADSAKAWIGLGGIAAAQAKPLSFADALTFLLTASMRQQPENRLSSPYQAFGSSVPLDQLPQSELKPSTFGCYILINALHVYIWETRQRHQGRQWKTQETEQMHAQVEPALRAWQAAWRTNPNHNLERPNPYGPLPADSIPLLDLAYVRLFVNLGRSKEAFWLRDFEAMADELGSGTEIIQHADHTSRETSESPETSQANGDSQPQINRLSTSEAMLDMIESPDQALDGEVVPGLTFKTSSKRERHLRKAAFYAADSLSMADKLGATFAEFTSRELPIQAAMCTFDCAQVLAEWIATVQARCGRYLGIIGRDHIDFTQVPSVMLLEDEDCKLLDKVNEILNHADVKIAFDAASMGTSSEAIIGPLKNAGYGSRLLLTTAYMLDKAAVWGITRIMARSMRIHAEVLRARAEASI